MCRDLRPCCARGGEGVDGAGSDVGEGLKARERQRVPPCGIQHRGGSHHNKVLEGGDNSKKGMYPAGFGGGRAGRGWH